MTPLPMNLLCCELATFLVGIGKLLSSDIKISNVNQLNHCLKSFRIRSFSGPYLPAFGLNTESLSVFILKAQKYGSEKLRIWTPFTQ